jgi:phosphopantothenoylcysteine decarboxylase/phosphopantothenate--cysteine ligase
MHPVKEICGTKSRKLAGKRIVLGVTGSIAAVECVKLARELIRNGAEIFPVMTEAAQKIIHPYSLEFASGNPPVTEIDGKVQHVAFCGEVEDRADMLLIAPSTANTISKIAFGIDDTTVTTFATTAIGSKIPVVIVPAMHGSMYNHPIVLENIEKLRGIGVTVIEPKLEEKKAKMPQIWEIVENIIRILGSRDLDTKKVLVIAGSTEEAVDDIRVITNRSSGKTGIELALNAYERGAEVDLWMGRCSVHIPSFISVKRFSSTIELLNMTGKVHHDIVIIPAAISDYSPKKKEGKIPSGQKELTISLTPNPKIIEKIREKSNCILVGFKAEVGISKEELLNRASNRMDALGLNIMVANDITETTKEENHVYILGKDGKNQEFSGPKHEIAEKILDRIVGLC